MTADSDGYLSHRQILVVMSGLMVGMFLAALDQSIVGTALPRITSDLGGFSKLSWVVTAYLLASTASTPLWGKISDLYGRRLLFQIAIVVFMVGSLASGFSQNIDQLIASRLVQGLGGGGLMAMALATVGDIIPPRERGRYQAYFAFTFGVSSVLGPVLGGFFADGPGWEWIFFINVPLGIVALVITSAALKMQHVRRDHTIDYLGAAVIVASVSSILLYTAWAGPEHGWGDSTSLALLVGGLVLAVAVRAHRAARERADHPDAAVPQLDLLARQRLRLPDRHRDVRLDDLHAGLPAGGRQHVAHAVRPGDAPDDRRHLHAPRSRPARSCRAPVATGTSRRPAPRWSRPRCSCCRDSMWTVPTGSPRLSMYVFGAGLGLSLQVVVVVVQNAVDRSDMGVATSSVAFFRQMGGSFGTALFGAILTSRLSVHLAEVLPGGTSAAGTGRHQQHRRDQGAAGGGPQAWCRRRSAARSRRCS